MLPSLIFTSIFLTGVAHGSYYGKFLGEFKNTNGTVKGRLYAVNKNTFYILGFSFTGEPDTYFWAGSSDSPSEDGFVVPRDSGSVEPLDETHEKGILLVLPEQKTINDLKWLSVWNKPLGASFDSVEIIGNVELPKEAVVGPLTSYSHGVKSGDVIVKDAKTLVIQNLYYDGLAPDAYFLVGTGIKPTHVGAIKLAVQNDIAKRINKKYQGENVTLTLPGELTVYDIEWLSIYCILYKENFGHLLLPKNLNVPAVVTYLQQRTAKSQHRRKYFGKYIGNLIYGTRQVRGRVHLADKDTIVIEGFTYDGSEPDAYFWAGSSPEPSTDGFVIPVKPGKHNALDAYNNENVILELPDGKNLQDIRWLSIWTQKLGMNLGFVIFNEDMQPPKHQVIGPLSSLAHGVKSGPTVVKDAQTLFIPHFYYDGKAPDVYFLVGYGKKPTHVGAVKVPDERGSVNKIRKSYRGESITLTLPGDLTVFDVDWFSVYCIEHQENFGHVILPSYLNVPPVLDRRNAYHHSKHPIYGTYIGELFGSRHVKGKVYVARQDTIFIQGFTYDGNTSATYLWAATSSGLAPKGFILPDEYGRKTELKNYNNKNIVVTLPQGRTLKEIKWVGVLSKGTQGILAFVPIPLNLKLPKRYYLERISSNTVMSRGVVIKDSKTIYIPDIYYKGCSKPRVDFLVGTSENGERGVKITDGVKSLKCFPGDDITLKLPGNLTIYDIRWFGLNYVVHWSESNSIKIRIPSDIVVPGDVNSLKLNTITYDGCAEILPDRLSVLWKLLDEDILYKLEGRLAKKEYMAFGLSGNTNQSKMVGSDITVVYHDEANDTLHADDYSITSKTECSDGIGVCPDAKVGGRNDVELLLWQKVGEVLTVVYKRPLRTGDKLDQDVPTKTDVAVVASVGQLNKYNEPTYHGFEYSRNNIKINFGTPQSTDGCRDFQTSTVPSILDQETWPPFRTAKTRVFRVQVGPDGGRMGYSALTGQESPGISWWINEMLIPEITVERGSTYTFLIEGGNDSSDPNAYHPFYITNDPNGGGSQNWKILGSESHQIYAGVVKDSEGDYIPTGVGRLCIWKHKSFDKSDSSSTFDDFKLSLYLHCDDGEAGQLEWTPGENTPDLVYYQCFIHRNLGWKIHVVNPSE